MIETSMKAVSDVAGFLKGLLPANRVKTIGDINKAAAENTMEMVVLFSSNLPNEKQQKIVDAVAIKTKVTIETVINSFLGKDPKASAEAIQQMVKNASQTHALNTVGDFVATFSEATVTDSSGKTLFSIDLSEGKKGRGGKGKGGGSSSSNNTNDDHDIQQDLPDHVGDLVKAAQSNMSSKAKGAQSMADALNRNRVHNDANATVNQDSVNNTTSSQTNNQATGGTNANGSAKVNDNQQGSQGTQSNAQQNNTANSQTNQNQNNTSSPHDTNNGGRRSLGGAFGMDRATDRMLRDIASSTVNISANVLKGIGRGVRITASGIDRSQTLSRIMSRSKKENAAAIDSAVRNAKSPAEAEKLRQMVDSTIKSSATREMIRSAIANDIANGNAVSDVKGAEEVKRGNIQTFGNAGIKSSQNDAKYFTNAYQYAFRLNGLNADGTPADFTIAFTVKITAVTIDANLLIDSMGDVNERDTFYQYLKMRAGKASFFKNVILNLDAIKKSARNNVKGSISERILAQLSNGSNILAPDWMRNWYEFRKFTVVITLDDADLLRSKHELSITRSGDLHRMFDAMSMLTLIVADAQDKKMSMTIFDSDQPALAKSFVLKSDGDIETLRKLLSGSTR